MKKNKISVSAFLLALSIAAVGVTSCKKDKLTEDIPTEASEGKNIVFITTDQEHYFAEYPEESNYEARKLLEHMGTTFEKHYCCANMSTSSRSVIYTGTHIAQTGMHDNTEIPWQAALNEDIVTIADRMNTLNYYCAYKGKWHMGKGKNIMTGEEAQAIDMTKFGFLDWGGTDHVGDTHEGYKVDPIISSEAVSWLESKGQELNKNGKAFFLAVNMVNPHDVMEYKTDDNFSDVSFHMEKAPDDVVYQKKYSTPIPSTWNQDLSLSGVVDAVRHYKKHWESMTGTFVGEPIHKEFQDYYFNCIQDNDNSLMKILKSLQSTGLIDNTIIVFTSDHGEMQGTHTLKGKGGFVYDNNIHVPLIIVHPDVKGGKRIRSVTSHLDLAPTFIDMTNASILKKQEAMLGLKGNSLMPLLTGSGSMVREGALYCFEMGSMASTETDFSKVNASNLTIRAFVRAIITDGYKFARYFAPFDFCQPRSTYEELTKNFDIELYDIVNDPEEQNNLAADPNYRETVMMLNQKLDNLIEKEIGVDDGAYFTDLFKK